MLHRFIAYLLQAWHVRLAKKMDAHLQAATKAAEDATTVAVNHEQATQAHVAALTATITTALNQNEQVQNTAKDMAAKAESFKHLME